MWQSRRDYLATLGTLGAASIAGCNDSAEEHTTTITPTSDPTDRSTSTPTNKQVPENEIIRFAGSSQTEFQAALDALATGEASRLALEPGTYRFQPPQGKDPGKYFALREAESVEIDGQGSKIVFTDPLWGGFEFQGGTDITFRNLELDYDPLPFTQGVITDFVRNDRTVRVELDSRYPSLSHPMFEAALHVAGSLHTPDGSFISGVLERPGSHWLRMADIKQVSDRVFDLTLTQPSPIYAIESGLQLALGVRNSQALVALATDELVLNNVTIRAAPGMAVNADRCSTPVLRKVTVAPPPDSGRCIGSNADSLHLSHCPTGPQLERCLVQQTRDDSIVINAELMPVASVDGQTVHFDGDGNMPVEPGNKLVPLQPTGERRDALPSVTDVVYQYPDRPDWGVNSPKSITFESSVDDLVEAGDYLSNEAYANAGFSIEDTTVRQCAANGIRLAARSGRIVNSTITGTGWRGIAMRCDSNKRREPQRWSNNIEIRRNTIDQAGMTYLAMDAPASIHATHNPGRGYDGIGNPHHHITVDKNKIRGGAFLGLEVEDAHNVTVQKNTIINLNQLPIRDGGGFGLGLNNVQDAAITDTEVRGPKETLHQFGWKQASTGISTSNNQLIVDGNSTAPDIVSWAPLTLEFDQTKNPGRDRYIAFRCVELALVDSTGADVMRVDIGGREMPVEFGTGVYSVDADNGSMARWFGGANKQATLYITEQDLSAATRLKLRGNPVADGITTQLIHGGTTTDTVTFGSPTRIQLYEFEFPTTT